MCGELLVADGLTKSLQGKAFNHFMARLSLERPSGAQRIEAAIRKVKENKIELGEEQWCMKIAAIGALLLELGRQWATSIGAVLLAIAGLCKLSGREEKDKSRPASKESRPQQELRERAKTPKGSWDEAAHPPIKGITGMAHDFRGDPRDQCSEGSVDAPGFRASRLFSLSSSHGMEDAQPQVKAFRAAGDPSRDQAPLPPPRSVARRLAREQARSLGTSHQDLYRHFDIPQPHGDRERLWWESERFDCWPVGADKWFQTREGLLVRTHNKPRRRSFHPLHRSVPIDVADLREERHTVIFPQDHQSQFVDPRPRFIESDSWSGNTTWSKDFRWRGYTVFILKSCQLDREGASGRVADDPILAAPRRANDRMFGDTDIHYDEGVASDGPRPQPDVRQEGHAAASSSGGYGHRADGVPMINVTVNVNNSFGGARGGNQAASTPPAGSSDDSEFEFVTP